jgi:hypothetical protein
VYFSHKQHVTDAKVTCDTCHGDVPQMDVMQKVKDISMAACIECHKSHAARVNCDTRATKSSRKLKVRRK